MMGKVESFGDLSCPVCGYYCLGKGGMGCIDKPMLVEIARSRGEAEAESTVERATEELRALRNCCSRRGAQLQTLRSLFREIDWQRVCDERPEMRNWFDEDGVPE